MERGELDRVTEKVIGCAFKVANTLGAGFVEKVYENAMMVELGRSGLRAAQQSPIKVYYEGVVVGDFFADILVDGEVIVELKVVRAIDETHTAQCMNYLKATGHRVCLLLNFHDPKLGIKRMVNNF